MRGQGQTLDNAGFNSGSRTQIAAALLAGLAASLNFASAQSIDPVFSTDYTFTQPGTVGSAGTTAITFQDNNTLLVGSFANANISSVPVTRGAGSHITGFGSSTLFAAAPGVTAGNAIDGGLSYGPGGVLFYTSYGDNGLGQIKPGSTSPNKQAVLTGFTGSVGSLGFNDAFPGHIKFTSYDGDLWNDSTLASDGSGAYNVTAGASVSLGAAFHPEGFGYVSSGNPQFSNNSVIIASAGGGKLYAYQVDGNGDPMTGTQRLFMTLSDIGGMVVDPVTGDLLGVQTGTGKIYEIQGFTAVPEPGAWTLIAGLTCLAGAVLHRRFNKRSATA